MRAARRLAALVALSLLLGGCVRGCTSSRSPIHLNPNMDDQPRATALQASDFFYDGKTMRQPIPGTVAREDAVEPGAFETGRENGDGAFATAVPAAAGEHFGQPLALRGAERYGIYCAPCHGGEGDGEGMLFTRAGVTSADLRIPRLREMPDGQLFEVISDGLGLMPPYRAQIPPADRWAIVAFIRQLQAQSPVVEPNETGAVPATAVAQDEDTPPGAETAGTAATRGGAAAAPGEAASPGDDAAPDAAPGGSR